MYYCRMNKLGGAPKCARCNKSVFKAEQAIGGTQTYHIACFRCKDCGRTLDGTILTEKDMEIYCRSCYGKKWGPKGIGFGVLGDTGKGHESKTVGSDEVVPSKVEEKKSFCGACGKGPQDGKFCSDCGKPMMK